LKWKNEVYRLRGLKFMSNKRLKELDILRAIAFIFVVAQHTLGGFSNVKGINHLEFIVMKFIYVMAKTAVPIFFFISAISLFYVYFNKFNWKNYYIKRLKYVLIPYIIWSAINMHKLGNTEGFKNFTIQLIAGNGAFHLWYMGTILRVYLFFPAILWIGKKIYLMNTKIKTSIFVGLVIIYYEVSVYQNTISDKLSLFIFKTPTEVQNRIVSISFLFWFLYFVIGIYFALNYEYFKEKVLKYKVIIIVLYFMLFIYAYLNELEIVSFIRSLSLLYTICSILVFYILSIAFIRSDKVYKTMRFIGDYSFVSYMAHIIVINEVVNRIRLKFHTQDYLVLGLLAWSITSIITPVIFSLISYIPYSQYITGIRKVPPKLIIKDSFNVSN
jgi:probable poly-beta-1,6-N-acetyl-D-glucosamine export protein